MKGISTFLWFDNQAEDAARFYVSVFPNSRITGGIELDDTGPGRDEHATTVSFELDGNPFTALNGGPIFTHSPAISFVIGSALGCLAGFYGGWTGRLVGRTVPRSRHVDRRAHRRPRRPPRRLRPRGRRRRRPDRP